MKKNKHVLRKLITSFCVAMLSIGILNATSVDETIQAENYSSQSGCNFTANQTGYTGSGFLDYGGNGTWGEWTYTSPGDGTITLSLRYANGTVDNRQCALTVNGSSEGNIAFATTGGWPIWSITTIDIDVVEGTNTIRLTANTSYGGPNLDKLDLDGTVGGDTEAPSVPNGLTSDSITETSFTLSWSASTDNVGVTGYEVFKDGASIGTTANTSMSVTSLTASTTYSMKVRATDAAGNWSAQSTALQVTTAATPTTITVDETIQAENYSSQSGCNFTTNQTGYTGSGFLDYGGNGTWGEWTYTSPGDGTITLSLRYANGTVDNRQCALTVNGSSEGNIAFAATGGWPIWNITTVDIDVVEGTNTIRLTANTSNGGPNLDKLDLDGTIGGDTEAPSIPIGLASGSITETSFTLSWSASTDNVGVTDYEVFKDGASIGTTANTSMSVTSLTAGATYSMKVRATDAAGNWSAQSSALNVTTLVPSGNLALNKTVTVSAYQDDSFGYNPGENLVDGDVSDDARWSASGFPQWAEIDLGSDYSLNEIKLYPYQNRAYQYIIEAKADGGSYSTIVDRSSNTEEADILADNVSGTARYLKITVSALYGNTSTWVSLSELEIYGSTGGGSDTQAPSVPTGLTAGTVTTSSIALSWNASTDNVVVTGYKIYTNGSNPVSVTGTSTTISGLAASTQYNFTVSAIDAASNESAQSSAIQATTATPPDTQAPSVPTGLTVGTITSSSIALSWTVSTDNVGITGYKVYTNGANPVSVTGTSATITGLAASTQYSFTVSAIDAASNESAQSSSVNATTTSAASGITSSTAWQSFTMSTQTGVFTATFDAVPNGSALDVLTGILNGSASAYGDIACIIRFNTSGQIDARNGGSYTATNVINYTSGVSYHFRVEISVPTHTYSVYVTPQGSSEQTVANNFAFRSEQSSVSQLTGWTLYAASGSHTVSNMTFTQAAPDTEAPSVPTNLVSSNIYATGFTLSWTASTDNGSVTGYEVFKNGASIGTTITNSMSVTGLSETTTYSMTVRARDGVPNWSAQSAAINVTTSDGIVGDWPTASTTGPSGTLTASGPITVTTNGAIIQNLDISGSVTIQANNVTIRNCSFGSLQCNSSSYTGTVVEDSYLRWAGSLNFTLRRCEMSSQSADLIRITGGNVLIEDCYLHIDGPAIEGTHADIIQSYPTPTYNSVIRHNTLYINMNQTGCVNADDVLIEDNLIAGGSYSIYGKNPRVINNHFSTLFFPNGGAFGIYYFNNTAAEWSGNVWHETGAPALYPNSSSAKVEEDIVFKETSANKRITLYPNPLNGNTLNVKLDGYDQANIVIYDLIGKTVYNRSHSMVGQTELQIPVNNLSKGIYIISVNGNQQKLIVE